MSKIALKVTGCEEVTFQVEGEPKSETDLLRYEDYKKFYYSIGLGAPVTAEVVTKKGLFSNEKYSFTFTIKGNAMSHEEMLISRNRSSNH